MNKYVLIVDDEVAILIAYRKLLRRPGVEIHTAETIEDAERSLSEQNYEVVISDLRLKGTSDMEGLRILRYIREHKSDTKVILVTAYGNSEIRDHALSLGASYYLEKPVLAEDLRKAISSLGVE